MKIRAFHDFWKMLISNSGNNVKAMREMMAIETLLIMDDLYRSITAIWRCPLPHLQEMDV